MDKEQYPNGDNEPDTEYNDFINADSENINSNEECSGQCENCNGCSSEDDALDNALLNSSALTKNANIETQYEYSNMPDDAQPTQESVSPSSNHIKRKHIPFKEQWEQVDELCPNCNHVTKEAKGITRQNMKRLLSIKGDPISWIMFLLLCSTLFFANLSWDLMTTPINCSNASNILLADSQNLNSNNQMPMIDLNSSMIVGNDSDEYGCKASAGYAWCANKSKCIRFFEESCLNESV